jgi:hypothetical protein
VVLPAAAVEAHVAEAEAAEVAVDADSPMRLSICEDTSMKNLPWYCLVCVAILLATTMFLASGCTQEKPTADAPEQKTFDSADKAADALVKAIRDWSPEEFKAILGPEAEDVLSSGDDIADRKAGAKFLAAYDEKHRWTIDSDMRFTMVVGNADWPMPIPVVKNEKERWYFDSEAGKDEIINRRIGRNELNVIQVIQAAVDAQREYAAMNPNGSNVPEYAQKIMSDTGTKNGLYWPTKEGEPSSPLGKAVADAVEEGYSAAPTTSEPRPFHGYCYRILKSQGVSAAGGAQNYLVNGRMTGGFAIIAYPADYGSSGIMTFIISNHGVLYQKDLAEDTQKKAKATESFDPGVGWEPISTDVATP